MPSLPLDDENLPLFTVGQVAGMLAVQQAFLRRLDEFGVVRPSRSAGGQRRYSRHEITIVQYVVTLADEGMSLAGIRRILELEDQVRQLSKECAELRRECAELTRVCDSLRAELRGLRRRPVRQERGSL